MLTNDLDKQTADEILRELFPSGCSPLARFAVELSLARHRGRVLAAVVGKRLTYKVLTAQGDAGFMGIK